VPLRETAHDNWPDHLGSIRRPCRVPVDFAPVKPNPIPVDAGRLDEALPNWPLLRFDRAPRFTCGLSSAAPTRSREKLDRRIDAMISDKCESPGCRETKNLKLGAP